MPNSTGIQQFDSLKWKHCKQCAYPNEPDQDVCQECGSELEDEDDQ